MTTTIACYVCGARPFTCDGTPPKIIFCDPYAPREHFVRDFEKRSRGLAHACRDDVSPRREREIAERELASGHWHPGEIR